MFERSQTLFSISVVHISLISGPADSEIEICYFPCKTDVVRCNLYAGVLIFPQIFVF